MLVFVALSVFLALDLASADWTMKVICDDQMNLWIDGELTTVAGQGAWNQMSTLNIPESTRSIGISCLNTGGPYGIMGSIQDAGGNDVLVTDDSWSCSNTADAGWEGPDFEEGDNWNAASYYAHREYVNKDNGAWQGMSPNRQIIWTASAADTTVYCRKAHSVNLAIAASDSCFVKDFDYGQADIKMIKSIDSAESCLAQCGKQAGCLSMAFDSGNGNCWLKNLLYGQNPIPKVGIISANLACQVPKLMNEKCVKTNFDYWGADIKKLEGVSSIAECADKCRETEGGKSVAFVQSSGDCWVKFLENGARPEDRDGVDSVALSCLDGVSNGFSGAKDGCGEKCLDKGIDYWGADIKNVNPIYTIEECTALCYMEEGCISLTHRPSTQDCWLKNRPNGQSGKSFLDTVNSINLNCFILAHVEADCVKENFDFRGADIRMISNVVALEDCAALCADEAGCVSVTHQDASSRCWLKNKRFGAEPQDMDGVRSRNLICGDIWCEHAGSFLYTYANSPRTKYADLEEAKAACVANDACNGVTQEPYSGNKYTLRRGPTIHDWSPTGETSWTLC